ncbi:PQQ-dependent sugar dehydrogenase [Kibdelosporangium lantanae]|uniref:PQQ-dependent sugar dehydrogenase n=1 Tax=Kibdelosporangium lantanae TaxID=1497396 RepID=A0ABW3M903_9PSEU
MAVRSADFHRLLKKLTAVETAENSRYSSFSVHGRRFGYYWPRTQTVGLKQTIVEQRALVAERPDVFEEQFTSGGFGIYYKNTHSGTITVQAKGEATTDSFLFVDSSTVDGSVQANAGEVRLHDPRTGTTQVIARIPVYNHDEDGLYGGAIDAQFTTDNWVYLYYAPPLNTPTTDAPTGSNDPHAWDVYRGYNQLSRFKFVDGPTPSLDMASEQKIMQVGTDRGACCHVAGEIRFDSHGNLLMTTGDDTPAGSGNSGGFAPFNDELTVPAKAGCPDPCYNAPYVDARRSAGNTNDLRGKLLRIHVSDDGSYTIPSGNLFAPGTAGTRPEIYAMGFRNPFRLNLDPNDVAYVTDYSPDSGTPQVFRGPPGVGRMEIVRHAANYGWPLCASPTLPYYRWNFTTSTPLDNPPQAFSCGDPAKGPDNTSRHNTGLVTTPPLTAPDMWYSYNDNNPSNPLGTPCAAQYTQDPPGTCPQPYRCSTDRCCSLMSFLTGPRLLRGPADRRPTERGTACLSAIDEPCQPRRPQDEPGAELGRQYGASVTTAVGKPPEHRLRITGADIPTADATRGEFPGNDTGRPCAR